MAKKNSSVFTFYHVEKCAKMWNENLSLNEGDREEGGNISGQKILLNRPKEFLTIR